MKNVAVSLMAIFFAACSGNKSPHSLQQEKEDLSAKGLLQGIWLSVSSSSQIPCSSPFALRSSFSC